MFQDVTRYQFNMSKKILETKKKVPCFFFNILDFGFYLHVWTFGRSDIRTFGHSCTLTFEHSVIWLSVGHVGTAPCDPRAMRGEERIWQYGVDRVMARMGGTFYGADGKKELRR